MTDQIRKNYFLAVKTMLILTSEIYLLLIQFEQAGASSGMFLLLALFLGLFIGESLAKGNWRYLFLFLSVAELTVVSVRYGNSFLLLWILLGYEIISYLRTCFRSKGSAFVYGLPLLFALLSGREDYLLQGAVALFTGIIYIQHDFIVVSYQKQIMEHTLSEEHLKKNLNRKEYALREELKRGLLVAENQVLEERARLSQTLHDKLGHSINGSVYQLEAVKYCWKMNRKPAER